MFRDFRHHILPCQRDGNSKPASVLLIIAQGFLVAAGSLQIISRAVCKIQARQDSLPLAPFSEFPSHGIRSRYYLFRVVRIPSFSFSVLPYFLHGSRMWLDWCAKCLKIITGRILHYPQFVSMSVSCFHFTQPDIPPQTIAAGSMPNKAA
jgi:hypothetical protein